MSTAPAPIRRPDEPTGRFESPLSQARLLMSIGALGAALAVTGAVVGFGMHVNTAAQIASVPGLPALPSLTGITAVPSLPGIAAPALSDTPALPTDLPSPTPVPTGAPSLAPPPPPDPVCRYVTADEIAQLVAVDTVRATGMGPECWYQYSRLFDPANPFGGGSPAQIAVAFYPGATLPTTGTRLSGIGQGARWDDSIDTLLVRTRHGVLTVNVGAALLGTDTQSKQQVATAVYRLAAPRLP